MAKRWRVAKVVVLNASFEPLGIVTLHRALAYVIREQASIVQEVPDAFVRSCGAAYPMPRVVQLREMVRVPHTRQVEPWSRRAVLVRDNHTCAYCGGRANTIDHVLPRSRGGANRWENTVAACSGCNGRKADRTPDEARMPLRVQPRIVLKRDTLVQRMQALGVDTAALGVASLHC